MAKHFGNTEQMAGWLARLQSGDKGARNGLVEEAYERLRRLASKMLRGHADLRGAPGLETGDLLDEAMLSLLGTFDKVEFESPRHFINLAAQKMRFRLIDVARKYKGELAARAEDRRRATADKEAADSVAAPVSPLEEPETREEWAALHEAVERLPEPEKEIVNSLFYFQQTQQEVADKLNVSTKTVQRKFQNAQVLLRELLSERSR